MTTPTDNFYAALSTANPCVPGADEHANWLAGALSGRANRHPPSKHSTPAYYEGWQWGQGWQHAQVEKMVAKFAEGESCESSL